MCDEFFVCNPIVIEISLIFCEITWRLCCTFWDPESKQRSNTRLGKVLGGFRMPTNELTRALDAEIYAVLAYLRKKVESGEGGSTRAAHTE